MRSETSAHAGSTPSSPPTARFPSLVLHLCRMRHRCSTKERPTTVSMAESERESEGGEVRVILQSANCELDLARIVLRPDGREVKLEPRAFDVLAFLVQRRGTVVLKQELLDEIWGDRFVS